MSEGESIDDLLIALSEAPSATPLVPGSLFGHYRISSKLGAGGMGDVYGADDTRLGRRVAIKVLPARLLANPMNRARFDREARTLAALNHPGIVTIHAVEEIEGRLLLVMELVAGQTLRLRIPHGGLPTDELLRLSTELTAAMGAAHRAGIVHRDVKPENVMISEDGRLKVLDFGLAKIDRPLSAEGPTATASLDGRVIGTAAYMSPEQAQGLSADARSDVFSLGIVLFEMATGLRPYGGTSTIAVLSAILREAPARPSDLNPTVPRAFDRIVARCLEKAPNARFQAAEEIRQALEQCAREINAGPDSARLSPSMRTARRWRVAALSGLVVAALGVAAAAGGWLSHRQQGPATRTSAAPMRRTVAVLGFKNLSGRPEVTWLTTALSEMLTTELTAGGTRTITSETVARFKSDIQFAEADTLTSNTLTRIRSNLGSDVVVLGAYLVVGGKLRLDVRALDVKTGDLLFAFGETCAEPELIELAARAGAQLRERLGGGGVTAGGLLALRAALPSNPTVARLYAEGLERLRAFD